MSDDIEARIEQNLFGTPTEETSDPEQTELQLVSDAEVEETEEVQEKEEATELKELEHDETLASILGLPEDLVDVKESGEVILKASIAGEEKEVQLKELLERYQDSEFSSTKSQELVEQQQKFEQEMLEAKQETDAKLKEMVKVSKLMEQNLLADFNQINWQQLEQQDPAEYNRLRKAFSYKAQQLKGVQETLTEEEKAQNEASNKQQQEKFSRHLKAESEKILAANPTWHNEAVKQKEMGELRNFLSTGFGYTDEEMDMIADSRLVRLIQAAYKNKAPEATIKEKKVVPAYQSPTGGRQKAAANARAAKAKRQRLRDTGSTDALTAVLMDKF